MTRPYSEDIRERALARADAGETVRSIAEALQISPSCVTKWKNLRRDTGSFGARQDRRPQEAGSVGRQCRLAAQAHSLRAIHLTQVDAGTGRTRDQDRRAGGVDFCSHRGAQLQKKQFIPPSKTVPTSPVNGPAGRRIKAGSMLRAWSLSTRRGSRPTWRRCAAGDPVGSACKHMHLSVIGRP